MKTVVGMYNTLVEADKVKSALQAEGYEAAHIRVIDQSGDSYTSNSMKKDESFGERVKDFFSGFTDHKDEHAQYADKIGKGGALLSITVPDEEADETADLLYQHGATGIENEGSSTVRAARSAGGSTNYSTDAAFEGDQVIPVVQEELVVGKRQVDRGGVRVYSHVVETPVSADVSLHNERVIVDRRPVDRAATEADLHAVSEVIEVNAMGEEAVIGKTSRVVEEVRVGKQAIEHTEQIHNSVRRTEVDVEPTTTDTSNRSS